MIPRLSVNLELLINRGALVALAFALLAMPACGPQGPSSQSQPAAQAIVRNTEGSRRDLSQDEAAGGHVLRKHVGRTDEQLAERLRHERNISAASTWNDRDSAEIAVGTAIAQQSSKIQNWLQREGGHPNLVLDYDGDPAHPFGRTLRRGEEQVQPCAQALIVLKWDGPNAYHVLTAYPECRR
jgi:Bacterial CdiA-CT RNAse A domain